MSTTYYNRGGKYFSQSSELLPPIEGRAVASRGAKDTHRVVSAEAAGAVVSSLPIRFLDAITESIARDRQVASGREE